MIRRPWVSARLQDDAHAADRKCADWVERCLGDLERCCEELNSTVKLFDHAVYLRDSLPKTDLAPPGFNTYRDWVMIAGRSGAIIIYRFAEVMQGIAHAVEQSAALRAANDGSILARATDRFAAEFPHFRGIRNAAAHALAKNPVEFSRHAETLGASTRLFTADNFAGRNYSGSYKGQRVSYEVSDATVDRLRAVTELFFRAFIPCDPFYRAMSEVGGTDTGADPMPE